MSWLLGSIHKARPLQIYCSENNWASKAIRWRNQHQRGVPSLPCLSIGKLGLLGRVMEVLSSKQHIRKGTIESFHELSAMCLFLADCLRCSLTKVGWEIRVFHDLQTHLNCTREFTGRNDRISTISSSGRNSSDWLDCCEFGWGEFMRKEFRALLLQMLWCWSFKIATLTDILDGS